MQNKTRSFSLSAAMLLVLAALVLLLLPGCADVVDTTVWVDEIKSGEAEKEPLFLFHGNTVAKPGDIVTIAGEYLDSFTSVTVNNKKVDILQPDSRNLQFEIPKQLNEGVYKVVLSGNGIKRGVLVNAPKVVWIQGDEGEFGTPGGWLRVNGECLSIDGNGCYIELIAENGSVKKLNATDVKDAFSVEIALPKNLAHGTYSLRYSNGYATSQLCEVKIDAPIRDSWPTDVFNILDYGGQRNNTEYDNAEAIKAAFAAAAENGGGVIYFPKGFYQMKSGNIIMPENVTLKGEGMNLVSIHWGSFADGSGWTLSTLPRAIFWSKGNCALEELTFSGALMPTLLDTDSSYSEMDYKNFSNNVYVTNCRVYSNMYAAEDGYPKGTEDKVPYDKDELYDYIVSQPMFRMRCQNFQLTNCELQWDTFILGASHKFDQKYVRNMLLRNNKVMGASFHTVQDRAIVEDNEIVGGTKGRFVYGTNGEKTYFARNRMLEGADSSDREIMCSDWNGMECEYHGPITFHDDTHVTFPEECTGLEIIQPESTSYFLARACVMIVNGTGTGQYRYVTERDGRNMTLEAPFDTWDETSEFNVARINSHWYVVDNYFGYTGDFCFYTGQMDSVVTGNETYFAAGFLIWGLRVYYSYQIQWYVTYEDNYMHASTYQHTFTASPTRMAFIIGSPVTVNIATTVRRNRFHDAATLVAGCSTPNAMTGFVIEDNDFEKSTVGISLGLYKSAILSGNTFNDCGTDITYPEDRSGILELD